jgi:hypothetical protein
MAPGVGSTPPIRVSSNECESCSWSSTPPAGVETDLFNWFDGQWTIGGQLVLNVANGQFVQAFTCEPWRNNQMPLREVITIPGWHIGGSPSQPTLTINVPAIWNLPEYPTLTLNRTLSPPETWSGWGSLGGYCLDGLALTSWGPERLDLFTVGSDAAIYHQFYNGTAWSGWVEDLGGNCLSAPGAVSRGPNLIDLFVIGPDHALYHQWYSGTAWSGKA